MGDTAIEWATKSWNPIIGCYKKSVGCDNCWAIKETWRFAHSTIPKIRAANEGLVTIQNGRPNWTGEIRLVESRLDEPLRWRKPQRVFVCSKTDLFHERSSTDTIARVFSVVLSSVRHGHTMLLLTKRPENMLAQVNYAMNRIYGFHWKMPDQIWFGCSVENQGEADNRRDAMRAMAYAGWRTWVSYEPALGPVNWRGWEFIKWLVAGAESGKNARPMDEDWIRATRGWCSSSAVRFYYKQRMDGRKKIVTPELDGRQWVEVPEVSR